MDRILSRVGVSYQIGLVGLIGVLGLVVVGIVYFIGKGELADADRSLAQSNASLLTLEAMKGDLLEARRAEKDYLIRHKDEFAQKQQASVEAFARDASAFTSLVDAERQVRAAELSAGVAKYKAQFAVVVENLRKIGYDENDGLQGKLRDAVHGIEDMLGKYHDDGLDAGMLMMRRHEKDFLARLDRAYIDKMKEAAAKFAEKLAASALPAADKAAITEKLDIYQRDFLAAAEASLDQVGAVAKLSQTYAEIEPVIGALDRLSHERSAAEAATAAASTQRTTRMIGFGIVLMIGMVGALAWLIGRGITRPLRVMAGLMERLSQGDLAIEVVGVERKDEVGTLARALRVFKDNASETERLRCEQEELKRRAEADKKVAMDRLAEGFEASVKSIVDGVSASAGELQSAAQSLSATAQHSNTQATAVATASEQASANVQTVATATEELSSSVTEISRQVSESTTICGAAVQEATETQRSIQEMAETAQKIGAVVTLINDIASQTNLLALNATIEAARAGEAGKGFAVVASEVKSLATQTAKATEEIRQQIGAVQQASEGSVKAIGAITATITRVNEIATSIASAVEEQGAATQEIARNVQQAAIGTQEVSNNIGGVSQAAAETGAAASKVLGTADAFTQQSDRLRREVDNFLATVREA